MWSVQRPEVLVSCVPAAAAGPSLSKLVCFETSSRPLPNQLVRSELEAPVAARAQRFGDRVGPEDAEERSERLGIVLDPEWRKFTSCNVLAETDANESWQA